MRIVFCFSVFLLNIALAQNANNLLTINTGYSIANNPKSNATDIQIYSISAEYGRKLIRTPHYNFFAMASAELQRHSHFAPFSSDNAYPFQGASKNRVLQSNARAFVRNEFVVLNNRIGLFADVGLEFSIQDWTKIKIQGVTLVNSYSRNNFDGNTPLLVRLGAQYNFRSTKRFGLGLMGEYHLAEYDFRGIKYEVEQSNVASYNIFFVNGFVGFAF